MSRIFEITFPSGHIATAANVCDSVQLAEAVNEMGLKQHGPTLVLVGGAGRLRPRDLELLGPIFTEALVPLVQRLGVAVVDGGTDAGVMGLMGRARDEARADFPLVGVAPANAVALPHESAQSAKTLQVEPHHTHFLFVPGSRWGDESQWMTYTVDEMAGGGPSVTILVDGGEAAWVDVAESVRARRPVIVVGGSGRLADTLAAALRGNKADGRALELAGSGLLRASYFHPGSVALAKLIGSMLSTE